MPYKIGQKVFSFAPASVANVGPCYDIMGYCLNYLGDFAEVTINDQIGKFTWGGTQGPMSNHLSTVPKERNAAYAVAKFVWDDFWNKEKHPFGVELILHKYMPVGSGLGSSAASGVAACKLIFKVLGFDITYNKIKGITGDLTPKKIGNYITRSEEVTTGTPHPDNVVPSCWGGFFVMATKPIYFKRIEIPSKLISVIVKPQIEISTCLAREKLRDYVIQHYLKPSDPNVGAINLIDLLKKQSSLSARCAIAAMENDIETLGQVLDDNELLEGARSELIPFFEIAKKNAKKAGAFGCSISGAGPAIVAITSSFKTAENIKDALIGSFPQIKCNSLISPINNQGAKILDSSIEEELKKYSKHHDFF